MASDVLVIGGGVAGMKAALLLASADRKVHLVEETSVIGGRLIRCEDVYPALECATCMVSPMQQEVLRSDLINVYTLSSVESVEGSSGDFSVTVHTAASCVDPAACIGCGECWKACPESTKNDFEEGLSERKAISVPCAGALPNVPWIDRKLCVRWTSDEECSLCADACVFGAVDFNMEDSETRLQVSDVILATGYETDPENSAEKYLYGKHPGVFTAPEFERCYASNGPTSGEILTKDGRKPESAAILVHPGGSGDWSAISTMYCLKFLHYLNEKLPNVRPVVLLDEAYSPGPLQDRYHGRWAESEARVVRYSEPPSVRENGSRIEIKCGGGEDFSGNFDLLIPGIAMIPSEGTVKMAEMLGIEPSGSGYTKIPDLTESSVFTTQKGIYAAGCCTGPLNIAASVTSASAAAGRVLAGTAGEE